eukprot:gene7160-biopygen4392
MGTRAPATPTCQRSGLGRPDRGDTAKHLVCLRNLKNMPADLCRLNLASAVLEIVRRDAKQRKWKASTVAKEYAAYAGALRDLPLYTTQQKRILLTDYPEWKSATAAIKRLEREMQTSPPSPITRTQCHQAIQSLRTRSPRAALFLAMMWALAARAGDVACLRPIDVSLKNTIREDGTVSLGIEQSQGKGARFRGTYWPASILHQEEATKLRHAMAKVGRMQLIFHDHLELRTLIRTALRLENRESALPSVRKGAIRHLAEQGLSEDTLMRLTGHKRVETLYRYLGRGLPLTREAVAAQDAVAHAHLQRQNT